ncbi:Leucine Rich Repeat (LRR) protein [Aquimarina sp. MAR_2010_214]|nr:Leucine Rich Repeat (LRR) protein [Aquimarina sp. MAR_2010_214]
MLKDDSSLLKLSEHTSSFLDSLKFHKLKKLSTLNLRENSLDYLPFNLTKLNKIEYLNLNKNSIEKTPNNLDGFSRLKYLDLRNNFFDKTEKERINSISTETEILF